MVVVSCTVAPPTRYVVYASCRMSRSTVLLAMRLHVSLSLTLERMTGKQSGVSGLIGFSYNTVRTEARARALDKRDTVSKRSADSTIRATYQLSSL